MITQKFLQGQQNFLHGLFNLYQSGKTTVRCQKKLGKFGVKNCTFFKGEEQFSTRPSGLVFLLAILRLRFFISLKVMLEFKQE